MTLDLQDHPFIPLNIFDRINNDFRVHREPACLANVQRRMKAELQQTEGCRDIHIF
jgi:hypothetical protein